MSLHETIAAMGGEPWCFDPPTIAKLTDYQITHVYLLPAARRARQLTRESTVQPTAEPISGQHVGPTVEEIAPDRESAVKLFLEMGLCRATAEAMADEYLKGK